MIMAITNHRIASISVYELKLSNTFYTDCGEFSEY